MGVKSRRVALCVGAAIVIFFAIIGILLTVAVFRALTLKEVDYTLHGVGNGRVLDSIPASYLAKAAPLLAQALTYRTVSTSPHNYNTEELLNFHKFLKASFPYVYNSSYITVEVVNTYSLLFTIHGSDKYLEPYMLTAHLDVVPVANETEWLSDPFGGSILPDPVTGDDTVWGRGAIDDKLSVMGILISLEYLTMSRDWYPTRSFYIALGHDEEVSGEDGAGNIGQLLKSRNVTLDFLLDEGMPVLDGVISGIEVPVAAIGIAEKGWIRLRVETAGEGGHSSFPPLEQPVVRLSRALVALDKYPQPSMFGTGPEAKMLAHLAPKSLWPYKLLFSNIWLFKPLLEFAFSSSRETNAIIRTTTAATIVSAGIKENVVPSTAWAIINHRVHPSQSIDDVVAHDIYVINDPKVHVTVEDQKEPHPVSPHGPDVSGFRLIASTIKHFFPNSIIAPSLMIANTDTRSYLQLTSCVYRFIPVLLNRPQLATIHGLDEHVSVEAVSVATSFYHHLIWAADVDHLHLPAHLFNSQHAGEL